MNMFTQTVCPCPTTSAFEFERTNSLSHIAQDLLHDRHRDMRNLSLVSDLLDVKRMEHDQLLKIHSWAAACQQQQQCGSVGGINAPFLGLGAASIMQQQLCRYPSSGQISS